MLGSPDVVPGIAVTCFRQRTHYDNGNILYCHDFLSTPENFILKEDIFIEKKIAGSFSLEMGSYAGKQDRRADRFCNIINFCCQENDGNLCRLRIFFQAAAYFIAIHTGHHNIQKNKVGRIFGGGYFEGLCPIRGDYSPVGVFKPSAHQRDVIG